jgi:branched-chain amino acid transport system permease protein
MIRWPVVRWPVLRWPALHWPVLRWPTGPTLYLILATLAALGVAGPFVPTFVRAVLIDLLMFMALAYSLNLITGLTGYVNFGHVIFMGIGAYALGGTAEAYRLNPLLGVLVGAALGFLFALGIGLVTLRFRGVYFAISSLVLVLAAFYIVHEIPQLGGSFGIFLNLGFQQTAWFFTIWTIVSLEVLLTYWITRGRIGYGIRALREDEDAARAIGVGTTRLKLILFSLSGLFAGAAGAVFAWTASGVFPAANFNLLFSLLMLAMIIIGGMGTLLGPFLGATIVRLLQSFLGATIVGFELIVIGVLVTVMALFLPRGIVGTIRQYIPMLRRVIE